jgi:hypothetical protein
MYIGERKLKNRSQIHLLESYIADNQNKVVRIMLGLYQSKQQCSVLATNMQPSGQLC